MAASLPKELAAVFAQNGARAWPASFTWDSHKLSHDVMTLRIASGQISIGLNDKLDDFLQAFASLVERALLDVATGQLFNATDPPAFHLLEHCGVAVLHEIYSPTVASPSRHAETLRRFIACAGFVKFNA
jgi:hypothetical protein